MGQAGKHVECRFSCALSLQWFISDVEGAASGGGVVNLCSCVIQMNTGENIAFISLASSHQSW